MTTSGRTSFLEESDEKRSEAERIRDQGKLALVPCLRCSRASEKCWVGADSKRCAYCTENMLLCTVNPDKYRHVDNAKAIVVGTQPTHHVSPEQGSEEAFKQEAERLYALNPSWHIQGAETKISSLQTSAARLSHRKRTGKHIRDERTLALTPCLRPSRAAGHRRVGIEAENRAYCTGERGKRQKKKQVLDRGGRESLYGTPKPKSPPRRKGISKPVDVLQGKCPITPKKVTQEPRRAEIGGGLGVASGSEYQPDSGSESPPRIKAERESVESSDGGQEEKDDKEEEEEEEKEEEEGEEEVEEETSPGSSEDLAALRIEVIDMRREMKEMRKEFRKGLERILYARK